MRVKPDILLAVTPALALLLVGSWWLLRTQRSDHGGPMGVAASLKTLAAAQADFRERDRDGNGKKDFWRKDVAGLFTLIPAGGTEPIKLIEVSVAAADERPVSPFEKYASRGPKNGYWFRAIRHADEKEPDPDRFAACAFPSKYPELGRWTFILGESNMVCKKDLGHGRGVETYPVDPVKEGWLRLD